EVSWQVYVETVDRYVPAELLRRRFQSIRAEDLQRLYSSLRDRGLSADGPRCPCDPALGVPPRPADPAPHRRGPGRVRGAPADRREGGPGADPRGERPPPRAAPG